MRALERLSPSRLPPELDLEEARQARLRELARAGHAMARAAGALPEAIRGVRLAADDRSYFLEIADRLARSSAVLAERAEAGDASSATAALADVEGTCRDCHDAFRVLPRPNER